MMSRSSFIILVEMLRIILIKVLLDQTLLTIPLLLGFFPYMSWCQNQEDVLRELKEKFWTTYALSCAWLVSIEYNSLYRI